MLKTERVFKGGAAGRRSGEAFRTEAFRHHPTLLIAGPNYHGLARVARGGDGPLLALNRPNLPCTRKAAIGYGKRTSGHPASLPRHRGRSKAPLAVGPLAGPGARPRLRTRTS
jgi:hypothetical protein